MPDTSSRFVSARWLSAGLLCVALSGAFLLSALVVPAPPGGPRSALKNLTPYAPARPSDALREFRGFVADGFYVNIDRLWHKGRYRDMIPLFYTATRIDPSFIELWQTAAWHLAFNVSDGEADAIRSKARVEEGLHFLDEAIRANPDRAELYFDKGMIYYRRLGDYDSALEWFRRSAALPHTPAVDRMIFHTKKRIHLLEKAKKENQEPTEPADLSVQAALVPEPSSPSGPVPAPDLSGESAQDALRPH